ncbi:MULTISPECIES: autotransporter outer membrane beta-barrel domain-containing protein [unclassified Pseudomonas]|uniref:autotransporter outer membrane beta-barrel domain-containing protein n=1 Tax=unclassified Pseudomonas TaxID=196821 RepID=UPI000BD86626|nr:MULTISPECIES: autotransporter outer membrane beta-barrel domain-containing protein [unclassified Pseudomonas]PVZ16422.1 outer membrane autotransporter protein [Pseudomonas sp. URIL14HWK12:I12]PVZ25722.1 outer membrane autotransporter protein [Pseudomonas sp. URIL14HWK12:I10]PVZ36754.1 outer membrane autotransporter protein [Pseudomonas sp. URIL14HWK12:I11]SNZ12680.1 outer membrane autotransporter barrel domain-containing protein [Pseudomonas sp. URIL14HWK12:I9]
MRRFNIFQITPLALFLTTANGVAWADIPVTTDTELDGTSVYDRYVVSNGATLIGDGASLESVDLDIGHLVLSGGSVSGGAGIDTAAGSSVSLDGVDVDGTNTALNLIGSNAQIANSNLIGGAIGVAVGKGAIVIDQSTVHGDTLFGLLLNEATAVVRNSDISGQESGITAFKSDPLIGRNELLLDNSKVTGMDGAAIRVGYLGAGHDGADIDIVIRNGTELFGKDGLLIKVDNQARAGVTVLGSALVGDMAVDSTSTLALNLGQGSSLTGNVLAEPGANASLSMTDGAQFKGRLENVDDVSIANAAVWTLTQDTRQENLTLSDGIVKLGEGAGYHQLTVNHLSGTGQFDLRTDLGTGQTDFVDVTGSSSGSYRLNVASSGQNASFERIDVARTSDGGAQFSLLNGQVDLGAWSYGLATDDGKTWYLNGSQATISPGAASALALYNTASTVWHGEVTSLRGRMGELRYNPGAAGGWVRAYGNKFNVDTSEGVGYRQTQRGFSLGADTPLPWGDGQWLAGAMVGTSVSNLDLQRGTQAEVKSYYVGAYATWLDADSGYYLDTTAKLNRFRNSADVAMSDGTRAKGTFDNLGVGLTVEAGRHIRLPDGWFVEPYGQLAGLVVQGRSFELDNGLQADGERQRSLVGKVGATVGRTYALAQGRSVQPYVRTALAHEFARGAEVDVNGVSFNNDHSGSRIELGTGVAVSLGARLSLNADLDYAHGERINQPWGVNAAVRYAW